MFMGLVSVGSNVLRSILLRFASRSRDEDETATEESKESGFRPSRLDASVLFAHGKRVDAWDDLAEIEERARDLERERRDE